MNSDRSNFTWLLLGFFAGAIVTVVIMVLSRRDRPAPIVITAPEPTAAPEPTSTPPPPPTPGPLHVYVSGEVKAPAVYELPPGSLVQDAINQAGGFTAAADASLLNLAQPLTDGMQVHAPAAGEAPTPLPITEPEAAAPAATTAGETAGLVNLNTATVEELDDLPGIGPTLAQNIVDYRQANGPFATIEDIMNVPGIGEGKFEQIKDLVTVK